MTDTVLLEAVAEVARLAGDIALSHFKRGVTVERKLDGSPVTIADRAAEQAARDWIASRFPEDGVVGEEFGEARPGAARRWFIDPIDGTKTFVRGVPLWGTLVGVADGDRVLAGAANFAAVGELLAAAPGQGCWHNGVRASVSTVDRVANATVLTTDERFTPTPERREAWLRLQSRAAIVRSWGDCYGYLLVATGRADAMIDPILSPWDAVPMRPIIEEAGGVFTDWSGNPTAFGRSGVATNAAIAGEVRALLREAP